MTYKSINVKENFGAVGDGVVDDTQAIQQAINFAKTLKKSSTYAAPQVLLPAGEYLITNELQMYGRMTLTGEGRNASVLVFTPSTGSVESLACISATGGPTSSDYIYFPEICNLTISLTSSSGQTANERYGIYMLYPTRAYIHNIEIRSGSAITSKDWVGIRTGREQGRYENISLQYMPVGIYLDGADNNNFNNISYIAGSSTTNTLPSTAIYSVAGLDRISFDGNQTIAGYDSAVYWRASTSSNGISISNMRAEGPTGSGYWFDIDATSGVISEVSINNSRFSAHNGLNINNVSRTNIDTTRFDCTGSELLTLGSSSYNRVYFGQGVALAGNPTVTLPVGSITWQDGWAESGQWVVTFAANTATPTLIPNIRLYKTANSSPTTVNGLANASNMYGRTITILFDDNNTTVDFTGTNLKGNSGVDWSPSSGDMMTCTKIGSYWYCNIMSIF